MKNIILASIVSAVVVFGVSTYPSNESCAGDYSCYKSPVPTETPTATASATPVPTDTPEPSQSPSSSPTPPSCGHDEHLDASGFKCVKWAIPESPEFFRNQGPTYEEIRELEGPVFGPNK